MTCRRLVMFLKISLLCLYLDSIVVINSILVIITGSFVVFGYVHSSATVKYCRLGPIAASL